MERKNCTKCKKIVISKVVIMWTSLTLRRTMRMLISTSPAFLTKRWNVLKTLTFMNWFGESQVIHSKKPSRSTSTKNNHSMHSAMSRSGPSWMQATLRFPRSSMRSRSGNASLVSITVIQESYIVYVDVRWQKIRPRIESISQPSSTHSPYRTSTSEKTDHVVIGMEDHRDAKNTLRRINLQRNAVKRNMIASTIGTSATRPSERQWLKSVAPNKWLSIWTSLRTRTTLTQPAGKKSSSTVAIGGSTRIWHALIQYRQGMNPNLKVRCQQCSAWSEQKTKRSKKRRHKPLHPRLRGTGIQAGGSLIMSTHLKKWYDRWWHRETCILVVEYLFAGRVSTCRRIWNFYCENRLQLTAVYCHRRGV